MKKIISIISICALLSAFTPIQTALINTNPSEEIIVASEPYKSNVKPENCYLCGKGKSLMPYYSRFDSIGLVCLNTWQIIDSRIRTFDDNGNPAKKTGSQSSFMTCGENECTFSSSSSSNRIMAHLTYFYGEGSILNENKLYDEVCQVCLENILEVSNVNSGYSSNIYDAILVDFKERKAYTLFNSSSYFIRDYYVHIDKESDGVSILILYCPEVK